MTSMPRAIAVAACLAPCMAFASVNTFNVTTASCSGSLASSFTEGISLACDGDYSLSGGVIESSQSITLSATGSLSLLDVILKAPSVRVNSGTVLTLGDQTKLDASGQAVLSSPTVSAGSASLTLGGVELIHPETNPRVIDWSTVEIGTGGTIHLQPGTVQLSTVPEPASLRLMLSGLLCAVWLRARHQR